MPAVKQGIEANYVRLAVSTLKIDPEFQREVDWAHVQRIADNWDPTRVGVIEVSRTTSGDRSSIVQDGQHRVLAARMVGVEYLFCLVVPMHTKQQKARRIVEINSGTKPFTPQNKFQILAKHDFESDANKVNRYLHIHGYSVGKGNDVKTIRSANALIEAYKAIGESGFAVMMEAFNTITKQGVVIDMATIKGLRIAISRHIDDDEDLWRIINAIGNYSKIYQTAKSKCIGTTLSHSPSTLAKHIEEAAGV